MKEVTQSILHSTAPGAEPGNCFAAVLASILELDMGDVPNICNTPSYWEWRGVANEYLSQFGLFYLDVAFPDMRNDIMLRACGYHEIAGPSPRFPGVLHSVVGYKGMIVWDPHPSRDGLVDSAGRYCAGGHVLDGEEFVFGFLIPLRPEKALEGRTPRGN